MRFSTRVISAAVAAFSLLVLGIREGTSISTECIQVLFNDQHYFFLEYTDEITTDSVVEQLEKKLNEKGGSQGKQLKNPKVFFRRKPQPLEHQIQGVIKDQLKAMGVNDAEQEQLKQCDQSGDHGTLKITTGNLVGGVAWGDQVNVNLYDFVVIIETSKYGGWSTCTGTIYQHHVLTAAHCFRDFYSMVEAAEATKVITPFGQELVVYAIELQPGHATELGKGTDLAVLVVGTSRADRKLSDYTPWVKIDFLQSHEVEDNTQVFLAGWGMNEHGRKGELRVGKFVTGCTTGTDAQEVGCAHSPGDAVQSGGADSGGPWFINMGLDEGKPWYRIVGVHQGGAEVRAYRKNYYAYSLFTRLWTTRDFWAKYFTGLLA